MSDLLIRFFIGGTVVSVFSVIGELFEPKTFAGLFGAAPSVAVATLTLTYAELGSSAVATSGMWMLIATVALLAYGACCVWACRRSELPVWFGAAASWLAWLVVFLAAEDWHPLAVLAVALAVWVFVAVGGWWISLRDR